MGSKYRSAALVIRVWVEDDDALRARLTRTGIGDGGGPTEEVTVAVAASASDVVDAVRTWLDGFATGALDSEDPTG